MTIPLLYFITYKIFELSKFYSKSILNRWVICLRSVISPLLLLDVGRSTLK